jgi:transposase InsO family protein/transposase-like protein
MKISKQSRRSSGEAWPLRPGRASPVPAGAGARRRQYSSGERADLLLRWSKSGLTAEEFAAREGLPSHAVLYAWRRAARRGRALASRSAARNPTGKTRRPYAEAERVAAVSAYRRSGLTQRAFAAVWGLSLKTLSGWLSRVEREGEQGLATRAAGRPKGGPATSRLPAAVQAETIATARRFPSFGLKQVSQYLFRFAGLKVAPATVSRTLEVAGVPRAGAVRKPPRSRPAVRCFERARPNELWQSDITSLLLGRTSRRVYLTVMLDDHSRYVVSFGLALQQRGDLVIETLLDGIVRFGKPREVLTDQGRQYFAWRGKAPFQKVLQREGIAHVVSRSHHPQTLGKCERLWGTVKRELWERCRPEDLADARERLMHFFAHYNHFRPHQGLEGMVPADRFFGVESEVRCALEASLARNELLLALGEPPRQPVYLVGQIGDSKVSLHGERGKLVIGNVDGSVRELPLNALGAAAQSNAGAVTEEVSDGQCAQRPADAGATSPALPAALADQCAGAPAAAGAGAVGVGDGDGAGGGAEAVRGAAGDVAGPQGPERGGLGAGSLAGADVAAQPVGDGRYAGGAAEATAAAWEGSDEAGLGQPAGGRCGEPAQGECGAAPQGADPGGAERDPAGPAGCAGQTQTTPQHAGASACAESGADGGKKAAGGATAENSERP